MTLAASLYVLMPPSQPDTVEETEPPSIAVADADTSTVCVIWELPREPPWKYAPPRVGDPGEEVVGPLGMP